LPEDEDVVLVAEYDDEGFVAKAKGDEIARSRRKPNARVIWQGAQALGFDVAGPRQRIADFVTPWQKCHFANGRHKPLEALHGRREIGVPSSGRPDELSGKPEVWSAEQGHAADHGLE
jgi:hypothetical protein